MTLANNIFKHTDNLYKTARQSGMGPNTLYRWAKGQHTAVDSINRLCQQLGCTPNELLSYGEWDWDIT